MKKIFTKDEWFRVTKLALPNITGTEFDIVWDKFMAFKALSKQDQLHYLEANEGL